MALILRRKPGEAIVLSDDTGIVATIMVRQRCELVIEARDDIDIERGEEREGGQSQRAS